MMLFFDVLIIAAGAAYVVTFAERWVDGGLLRGLIALAASVLGVGVYGYSRGEAVVASLSAAYLALLMVLIGERLATPPPMVVDPRRR